jgi:hypothetical protein
MRSSIKRETIKKESKMAKRIRKTKMRNIEKAKNKKILSLFLLKIETSSYIN